MSDSRRPALRLLPLLAACWVAATWLAPAAPAEEGTLLRLKLAAGESHRFAMTQTQQMTMQMGPMGSQSTTGRNLMELRQDVRAVRDDGSIEFDMTYERVRMQVEAGPASMDFDSEKEPAEGESDPMSGFARGMVGKTIQIVMSPRAQILEVQGVSEMIDGVLAGVAEGPAGEQIGKLLEASFGEDTIRSMMQQGQVLLPEKPVRSGDRWSQMVEIPASPLGALKIEASYTAGEVVSRKGRECLEVAVEMKMTAEGESPMAAQFNEMFRQQGVESQIDWEIGDSQGTGTLWIDKATGLTVESTLDQTMSMTMNITTGTAEAARTMNMQMDLQQNMLLEMVE